MVVLPHLHFIPAGDVLEVTAVALMCAGPQMMPVIVALLTVKGVRAYIDLVSDHFPWRSRDRDLYHMRHSHILHSGDVLLMDHLLLRRGRSGAELHEAGAMPSLSTVKTFSQGISAAPMLGPGSCR